MITEITLENFTQFIEQADKPVVVDAFATWCGPCQHMKPFFEELAETHQEKYAFGELNIDEQQDLAVKFSVTSVPTLVFFKNGEIVAREIGYMSKEDLEDKIKQHLG